MNFRISIWVVSLILALNFHAVAQIPSDANLQVQVSQLSETNFSGIISNTQPNIQYEIQRRQNRTNWISLGFVFGSYMTNWTPFNFRTTNTLNVKTIRVRSWISSDGSGIPDWWKLRYFGGTSTIDPNAQDAAGDGWSYYQKFQMGVDPFQWHQPAAPQQVNLIFGFGKNFLYRNGILSWQYYGLVPDYFTVERADRTLREMTNRPPYRRVINGQVVTNLPPYYFRMPYGRPGWRAQNSFITGPYEVIAKVPGQPNVHEYHYTDTNVNAFPSPVYRIQAHFQEPVPFAKIKNVSTEIVRKTILSVTAKPETNGYVLTVWHPALHVRYLLLVRDKKDRQWRASGYFVSGTNGNPVYLHVDKQGMMTDTQAPISMPAVKFLSDVVEPEFTAGYGEDSDGDYLPDIYEVLVTHTDPANDDTGDTGVIDGFKKMTSDGLSNFEKFRCRVDPLRPAQPPAMVELKQPTGREIMQAITPKSDLSCELEIEVRTNDATGFQPVEKVPWMFSKIINFRQLNGPDERRNFDLRISWRFAEPQPDESGGSPDYSWPASYQPIESLAEKINVQLLEAFKANLATNPPVFRSDVTNLAATIERAYHAGEMDKGLIMEEMMLLEDSQPQFVYGKVIDQNGRPVVGAKVTVQVGLDFGRGGTYKTNTDAAGYFQFTGLRGKSLSITAEKEGYQNTGQGLGFKGPDGTDTSTNNRASYILWKLKGPEPMVHKED